MLTSSKYVLLGSLLLAAALPRPCLADDEQTAATQRQFIALAAPSEAAYVEKAKEALDQMCAPYYLSN